MPDEPVDHILGMSILHDAYIWPSSISTKPVKRAYDAYKRFGWTDDLEFVPYWKPREVNQWVQVAPEATVASVFVRPNRNGLMIVLFNNSDQDQQVQVRVNRSSLKLSTNRAPEDFYHGGKFPWQGDSFTCLLKKHNFRMIAVE